MKEIQIDCPCCEAKLTVDVLTQKVLRHSTPTQLDEFGKPIRGDLSKWDAATDRIERAKNRGTDAFDAALGREQARDQDLDDLFDKAKSKVDKRKQDLEE